MINRKIIGIDARMIEMSGIGTYIQHLMEQGIYDYALGNEDEIRRYDRDVKVISWNATIYSPKEQMSFPNKAVRNVGIDIMHFPHYNVPFFYRGKYVVTVHDLTHIVLPEFLGSKVKYYYARFLMSYALRRAAHIFTVSENSKKDIQKYFGIKENNISITYDAIDDAFHKKDNTEIDYLYEKYKISRNKKKILYVGNLKPHKNLIILLKSINKINRDDIVLILVGKAFKNFDLEEQERHLGISKKVIHTGMVSKEELIDFYNLADLFVFPSLYEGFGIPLLEAMACGTPVIAANNSSIPEVCGNAAIFVDGNSADELAHEIEKFTNNAIDANQMIERGFKRVSEFSWEKTVSITKKHIKECVI